MESLSAGYRISLRGGSLLVYIALNKGIDRGQVKGGRIFYSNSANEATMRSMPGSWDFVHRLGHHPFPVTVIIGDHDFADWRGAYWTRIADSLTNVDVVMLEKAGHNAWIDRPKRFAEVLRDALQRARHPIADSE